MKRALCIGLNYAGSPYELPDCHLDANNIQWRAALQQYDWVKYTDTCSADEFLAELVRLREASTKTGKTLIMYSGHGTQWFSPRSGEPDLQEEGLCLWNGSDIEVFPDDDFRNLINKIKGTVFVFLDCCFSGGMERDASPAARQRKFVPFDDSWRIVRTKPSLSRAAAASGNKVYFMFASQESEVSWSTGQGGLFTNAFCEQYDKFKYQRTVKNVVGAAAKVCLPDQRPFCRCLNGAANKKVF